MYENGRNNDREASQRVRHYVEEHAPHVMIALALTALTLGAMRTRYSAKKSAMRVIMERKEPQHVDQETPTSSG